MKNLLKRWFPANALKNISIISIGRFFTYFAGFIYGVAGFRILKPRGFGQLALIISAVRVFSLPVDLRLGSPILKLIKERLTGKLPNRNRNIIRGGLIIQTVSAILFGLTFLIFLWFFTPRFQLFYDWQTALGWFALSELLFILRRPINSIFFAYEKFGWQSAYAIWTSLCRDFLPIGFMITGGVQGACQGYFIGELITVLFILVSFLMIWKNITLSSIFDPVFDFVENLKLIFYNTRSNYIAGLFNRGYTEIMQLILGGFAGPTGVGYFNVGKKLQKIFSFTGSPIKTYLFPRFIEKWNVSREEFYYTFRKYFYQLGPIMFLLMIVLGIASPWLVPQIYGEKTIPALPLVWIMLPAFAIQNLFSIFNNMAFVISRQRALITKSLVTFFTGIPLAIVFIHAFGYTGAAMAFTATAFVVTIYEIYFFQANFGWKWIIPDQGNIKRD